MGKLKEHLRTECRYEDSLECEFCGDQIKSQQLEGHQNLEPKDESSWQQGCTKARLKCIYCEDTIERQRLDEHLNMEFTEESWLDGCQNVEIKCVKEPCEETLERHQMKKHFECSHPSESQEEVDYGEMERKLKEMKERRLRDEFEEKHLGLVLTITWDARDKWCEIGKELGLNLESSMFEGDSVEGCFARMINLWLTSDHEGEKRGQVLVNALKSPNVGCENVAESVEKS